MQPDDNVESMLLERMRELGKDKTFAFIPMVLIKCFDILLERSKKYNQTKGVYEKTFTNGDAEAFINTMQTIKRIEDIIRNGNNHLECEVPMTQFEDDEILEDALNWTLIWGCCRRQRRENG